MWPTPRLQTDVTSFSHGTGPATFPCVSQPDREATGQPEEAARRCAVNQTAKKCGSLESSEPGERAGVMAFTSRSGKGWDPLLLSPLLALLCLLMDYRPSAAHSCPRSREMRKEPSPAWFWQHGLFGSVYAFCFGHRFSHLVALPQLPIAQRCSSRS